MGDVATRQARWTNRQKEIFLDTLAGSCNIAAAARAAQTTPESAHRLRRKDVRFAEQWGEALAHGYAVLETRMVGRALAGKGMVTVDLALKLLQARRMAAGPSGRTPPAPKAATREETDKAILKKLDAYERRRAE